MQTILLTVVLFFSVLLLQAQNTIEVSMINFRTDDGTVKIGLYNEEAKFLNIEYKTATSDISENRASTIFTGVPDGVYAISCYHDENGNEEFDMYFGVIPKEPYASSNDAKGMFGPPAWEVAKFEVVNGETKELIIKF
jgi:uncharacterized protein (DUF2141 family)